ncbi:MAG TPA: c-type cytochrome [Candidatus Binatia bacterium]|jgi:mono/diheme cytochrome c family protein
MRIHLQLAAAALAAALSARAAAADDAGKAAYDRLCVSCHGADGKGNPAMAEAFGGANLDIANQQVAGKRDEELMKIIADGRGKMPAAGKSLSPADQQAVIAYIRSLVQ